MRRIFTVTLNSAIDELKDVSCSDNDIIYPAGKGINVARALASTGYEVTAFAFCGKSQNNFFQSIQSDLLHVITIPVEGETRINTTLYDSVHNCETHNRTIGYAISNKQFESMLSLIRTHCHSGDIVIASGSLPRNLRDDAYCDLISMCNSRGIITILDSDGLSLIQGVKSSPFLIKPNLSELGHLCDINLNKNTNIQYCIKEVAHQNNIPFILVSMGDYGAFLYDSLTDKLYYSEAIHLTEGYISSVGCGDSMLAGFVASLLNSSSVTTDEMAATLDANIALVYSIAYGTANLVQKGPGILSPETVHSYIRVAPRVLVMN